MSTARTGTSPGCGPCSRCTSSPSSGVAGPCARRIGTPQIGTADSRHRWDQSSRGPDLFTTSTPIPTSYACETLPPASVGTVVSVVLGEQVPFATVTLPSPTAILGIGHGLEMGWVAALGDEAQMIEYQPIGNRAYQHAVHEAMNLHTSAAHIHVPVETAAAGTCTRPDPATPLTNDEATQDACEEIPVGGVHRRPRRRMQAPTSQQAHARCHWGRGRHMATAPRAPHASHGRVIGSPP